MRTIKNTSLQIVMEAPASSVWIIGGIAIFGIAVLVSVSWLMPDFSRQDAVLATIMASLFLTKFVPSFFIPTVTATFDKSETHITLERKWLWKTQTDKYPLGKVKDVLVVQKGHFGKSSAYFKMIVRLYSGEQLPLSAMNYRPKIIVEQQANTLQSFLESDQSERIPIFTILATSSKNK